MKYGKIIEGNLEIDENNADDFSEVEEITGSCNIYSNVELPKLTTIGGSCDIYSNVEFKASKNLKKYNPNARSYCFQFTFNVFLKLGFVWADNILMKFLSKKTNKDGMTVYKTQDLTSTKTGYCIEANGIYSHGDTIKQAKADLIYKISNRDTSQYKDLILDSVVTKAEAIKMYRVITGACEAGTKHFVSGLTKTKAKYKISELIELTKGQYGNKTFKNFFEGK